MPFLGEMLRMCLAVMKERNVVRLGSKSRGFFFLSFFLWLYRFLVFQVKDFVEEYCFWLRQASLCKKADFPAVQTGHVSVCSLDRIHLKL